MTGVVMVRLDLKLLKIIDVVRKYVVVREWVELKKVSINSNTYYLYLESSVCKFLLMYYLVWDAIALIMTSV